ncbi:MAG: GntR family transcriptional regulator [Eubacteriales bacterium]|nr:GntR family transcriptional regulator [Eubacteriales bacterium]
MIDKMSPIPIYFQLKEKLQGLIEAGELKKGDRIYSENELCEMYDVSRITAKRALDELVKDGYINRLPGRGSFVQGSKIEHQLSNFYSFSEEVKKKGMVPSSVIVKLEVIEADEFISGNLGIKKGDKVHYLKRLRKADDRLIALDRSFIPLTVCSRLTKEELDNNSLYQVLTNKGIVPERATEYFYAEIISDRDAELLNMKRGQASLKVGRKTYCQERLIEYNYRYYKGQQYSYSVELK